MTDSDPFRTPADAILDRFQSQKRVLTFWEFLEEVREDPYRRLRSAASQLMPAESSPAGALLL